MNEDSLVSTLAGIITSSHTHEDWTAQRSLEVKNRRLQELI